MAHAEAVMVRRSAGWYADPVTVGAARYWDGRGWTDLVSWGGATTHDLTPLAEVERSATRARVEIVTDYVADAARRDVISPRVADTLRRDVEQRLTTISQSTTTVSAPETRRPAPSGPPAARPAVARTDRPETLPPPSGSAAHQAPAGASDRGIDQPFAQDRRPEPTVTSTAAPVQPIPVEPGRLAAWWQDARGAIRSDLALHGLAYLGVLLLFAGVTGLIAFSFGDVAPSIRVLAEVLVPTALFVSAWYLHSRGASVVAASLVLLGGAILPVVVIASLTDGAPVPPDLSGRALPVVQGISVAVLGVVMALVARRSPSSPLRFVAAPMIWVAAGLVAGVTRDPVPAGYETARPDSLQLSVILAALTATVLLCAWRRIPAALAQATRAVALPVAGVVYVLELILAGDAGWPLASTIVVGVSMLVLVELSSGRLTGPLTSGLQLATVAVAAARLAAVWSPEWVAAGAAITLLALLEYIGWRRPSMPVAGAGLGITGVAFLFAVPDPAAAAVAFGVLTVWGVWRHVTPPAWLPRADAVGVVPAIAAVVTTSALWDLTAPGPALLVTAASVLVLAVAGRVWRPIAADVLWQWFVPTAAIVVTAVSMVLTWGEWPVEVAIASAMTAMAIVLSAAPVAVRAWLTAAVVVWASANAAEALEISRDTRSLVLASAAVLLVLGSLAAARPICVHLATIGHVAGFAALATPTWPSSAAAWVVAAATAGWVATTIVDERREAVHLAAIRAGAERGTEFADIAPRDIVVFANHVAPLTSLVGLWATVFVTFDVAGWVSHDDPWAAAVSGAVALFAAGVVRVVGWRRARPEVLAPATLLVATIAAVVAIVAVASDRGNWSPVVGLALVLAAVGVTAAPRPLGFIWTAWVGGAALSVLFADRLGLDRDWSDLALAGWGAAALLGGLAVHRHRNGPYATGTFTTERLLAPPIVLGAAAFVVGGSLGLGEGNDLAIGATAAGMSAVVLAVALLLPLGAMAAIAQALATVAYVLLAPWEPSERPWTFVPWVVILLLVALATRRSGKWTPARWDLPAFVVAHGVAGLALMQAVDNDTMVPTFALVGGVALAIAVALRRWEWAVAAAVLVLVAGLDAGPGWLALVLLVEGVALTVSGLLRSQEVRWMLLGLGALALFGAWFDLAAWQSWSESTLFYSTVPGAAAVALLAAIGLRTAIVPRELAGVWAIIGSLVAFGTMGLGDAAARQPAGLTTAGALLLLALAAGTTAAILGPLMRWLAALLAAAAWVPAAWGLEPSETVATLVGSGVALAVLAGALAVHGLRPSAAWLVPGAFYGGVTQAAASIAALAVMPDHDLLIVVLLAISAELVASAVLSGRPEMFLASPVPACAAWLLYARDVVVADVNWFTVPIGLTVLVIVALLRWIRRGRGGDPAGFDVVVLDMVGMTFLVGAALARTLDGHLWNGVLAIGIGVVIAGWGLATRVRWRAGFGAGSVVLAVILLIGVPLSKSVTWTGPALWVTLSVVGIAAIVVASALERSRDHLRQIVHRLDEMTSGWERIPHGQGVDDKSTVAGNS